jgi:uncharacterized protein YecE (DUF72 family)
MSRIYIGVGGWDFDPWRGSFYPEGLARTKQLAHMATRLNATEVNATYYSTMTPATFAKWRDSVPEGFVFALKASRFCTNRKVLADGAPSIEKFRGQGLVELGDKLGPINWQLAHTKKFDAGDIAAFLALLPESRDGVRLRHAIEPRHPSFQCAEFVALCRKAGVAIVVAAHDSYPQIGDPTAAFLYVRLQLAREKLALGYSRAELDRWRDTATGWAAGASPQGLLYHGDGPAPQSPRDVFLFFIGADKVRNPQAAEHLRRRLK